MRDLVDAAQTRSAQTCEQCGSAGSLVVTGNWYLTLCEGCARERGASSVGDEPESD
jgi:ribosomal protein S14